MCRTEAAPRSKYAKPIRHVMVSTVSVAPSGPPCVMTLMVSKT